ncbi:VIP peptides-like [Rhinoraja longicauda]
MVISFDSHSLTLFALLSVLCSQGSGFPALGSYPGLRLGDAVGFDGQGEEDRPQLPLGFDNDIYQSPTVDSEKLHYQLSANFPRTKPHTDGLFTSEYSKMQAQLSARKYLESLIGGRPTRHTDGLFTSEYSKMLGQLSARRYLESLIGKRVSTENLVIRSDTDQPGEN